MDILYFTTCMYVFPEMQSMCFENHILLFRLTQNVLKICLGDGPILQLLLSGLLLDYYVAKDLVILSLPLDNRSLFGSVVLLFQFRNKFHIS